MSTTKKPKWHEGRMVAFDIESTGVNPLEDRIVTASVVFTYPDKRPRNITWLIDPGIDIPDEAAEVHGWTNDRLKATLNGAHALHSVNGAPPRPLTRDGALFEIAGQLGSAIGRGEPLVVFNAAYDLTMVDAEAMRHDVDPVASRPAGLTGVVDPMILEKAFDPYRKAHYKNDQCDRENNVHVCGGCRGGKWKCGGCGITDRKLTSLCRHYQVPHTGAHDATGDALATTRLVGRLMQAWPDVARLRLATLHQKQIEWRAQQQAGLREFFDKLDKPHDGMCPAWPQHTSHCAPAHRQVVAA